MCTTIFIAIVQLLPKYYMRFIDAGSGFFEPSKRAMSCHSLLLAVGVAHA